MKKEKKKRVILPLFILTLMLSTVLYVTYTFTQNYEPILVSGSSMFPTLRSDEKYIIKKTQNVKFGDIVSFQSPEDSNDFYIKRVIGVAGDKIEYKDDKLYRNGEYITEPYLEDLKNSSRAVVPLTPDFNLGTLSATQTETVPDNKIFVMGDNRIDSKDSRFFGFIDVSKVVGTLYQKNKT